MLDKITFQNKFQSSNKVIHLIVILLRVGTIIITSSKTVPTVVRMVVSKYCVIDGVQYCTMDGLFMPGLRVRQSSICQKRYSTSSHWHISYLNILYNIFMLAL